MIQKGTAITGIVISLFFSFLGFVFGLILNAMVSAQDFIDGYVQGFLEADPTLSRTDALASLDVLKFFVSALEYTSIFFLFFGLIALILAISAKPSNVKGIGVVLLIYCFLLFFGGRILAFILVLIGSIKFIQYREPINTNENHYSHTPSY